MTALERRLFALCLVVATARAFLQIAAMPPYAGLDEIYHVARVNFVLEEGRNPLRTERSVPSFLHDSMNAAPGALPDFAHQFARWPEIARSDIDVQSIRTRIPRRLSYLTPSYEAQQPSLYYWVAATALKFAKPETLAQLRAARILSALLAAATVVFAALLGQRAFGAFGIVAAMAIPLLPTWHTLTLRASNDALATAAVTAGLWLTIRGAEDLRSIAGETAAWAIALAAKLYTWPIAIVLAVLIPRQRASKLRIAVVAAGIALSVALTAADLHRRTGGLTGLQAFDQAAPTASERVPIDYTTMLIVTVASAIWMSGQHGNALTLTAMIAYSLPLVVLVIAALLRRGRAPSRFPWLAAAAAVAAFAAAQGVHAWGFIQQAIARGESLPAAGKEGWYWYTLAPLVLVPLLAVSFARFRFAAAGVLAWLLLWDVVIAEGALFRDYAGLTSAATPGSIVRWGPAPLLSSDLFDALPSLACGPWTSAAPVLRLLVAAAIAGAIAMTLRPRSEGSA